MDAALTVLTKLAMRQYLMLHEGMLAIVLPREVFLILPNFFFL